MKLLCTLLAKNLGDQTMGKHKVPIISTRRVEFKETLQLGRTRSLELDKNVFVEVKVSEVKNPS